MIGQTYSLCERIAKRLLLSMLIAAALFTTNIAKASVLTGKSAGNISVTGVPVDTLGRLSQSSTTTPNFLLSVKTTPTIKALPRVGINLGSWNAYEAGQYITNIAMNPGFEPVIDRAIVIVQNTGPSGFSDNSAALARPDGFWNNATFEVRTGASAGVGGTIASSVAVGSAGLPWFTTSGPVPPLAPGDVVSITQTQTTGLPYTWQVPSASRGYVGINLNDRRPGSPGHSVAELKLRSGQSAEIDAFWDATPNTIPGGKFLPVNGNWQLSVWARATSGLATLQATFARSGSKPFLNQKVILTNSWQQIVLNFNATDSGPAGALALKFIASGTTGTSVYLDDVQLGRTSELTNTWRREVIQALQALRPGYLRDLQLQYGDTMSNRLASTFARAPQRYQPDPGNNRAMFLYGIPDLLSLAHQVGALPWIVVPATLYDNEFTQLGSYLASQQSIYNFSEIVVEFGNENWNPMFRAGSIPDAAEMAEAANRGFAELRSAAGSAVPLHLVINGAFNQPHFGSTAVSNAPEADAVDVAPYFFQTFNAADTQAAALGKMFDGTDEVSNLSQLQSLLGSSNTGIDAYELNLETIYGSATAAQRNSLDAGMVSGPALVSRLITGMNLGVRRQMVFALAGYNYNISSSAGTVDLFGAARDLVNGGDFRPTGLALELLNGAIAGDFYQVSSPNNSGINAAAFYSNAAWSIVVTSSNPSATSITIQLPANGAPPVRALTLSAPSITSNNESATNVVVTSSNVGSGVQVAVPAYGMMVLTQ